MLGLYLVGALDLDGHFRISEDSVNLIAAVSLPISEAIFIVMVVQICLDFLNDKMLECMT